ncbi:MAG: hypothetical protein AABW41_01065 [Nanoarchaeota archaeon]
MIKTKLEEIVESMVALKRTTSPSGIISDRSKRLYDEAVQEAYDKLKHGQGFSESSIVKAELDWKDENRQKGMALGIQEFEKKYPEHGKILREIIAQHRKGRRAYVDFQLLPGQDLPEEFYITTIMGLGKEFTLERAEKLYVSLKEFWDKLGREKDGKYSVLLEE